MVFIFAYFVYKSVAAAHTAKISRRLQCNLWTVHCVYYSVSVDRRVVREISFSRTKNFAKIIIPKCVE